MTNSKTIAPRALLALAGLLFTMSLTSCQKKEKTSSAGGGASSQSVLQVKGAAR